jgi:hypothetical protein
MDDRLKNLPPPRKPNKPRSHQQVVAAREQMDAIWGPDTAGLAREIKEARRRVIEEARSLLNKAERTLKEVDVESPQELVVAAAALTADALKEMLRLLPAS